MLVRGKDLRKIACGNPRKHWMHLHTIMRPIATVVDAVDAHFHCHFWRSQWFRRTISQKSAYIGASGASGRLNGAACDAGTADLKPDELVPKIVVKMVRLFFTPPAYTLLHDLADRSTATFECLGAVCRAGEGEGLLLH